MATLSLYDTRHSSAGGFWQPARWDHPDGSVGSENQSWWLNPFNPATPISTVYTVEQGGLNLTIQQTPSIYLSNVQNAPYIAPLLHTFPTFSQLYGYYEIQCAVPAAPGTRALFRLLPKYTQKSPPSIYAFNILTGLDGNPLLNFQIAKLDGTYLSHTINNWTAGAFHTYGMNWAFDRITYYVDGNTIAEYEIPPSLNMPMFMVLSYGAGANSSWEGAPPNNNAFPATMFVKYIRVWPTYPY